MEYDTVDKAVRSNHIAGCDHTFKVAGYACIQIELWFKGRELNIKVIGYLQSEINVIGYLQWEWYKH